MPANARMAGPLVLALVAWGMFISVGVRHNGPGYFKEVLFPPGVPKAFYLLVTLIEFLSTLVRPFSHAVRLFANMLAGHILLITFGVLCISVWSASALVLIQIGTFPGLCGLHRLRGRCVADPGVRLRSSLPCTSAARPPGALIARSVVPTRSRRSWPAETQKQEHIHNERSRPIARTSGS